MRRGWVFRGGARFWFAKERPPQDRQLPCLGSASRVESDRFSKRAAAVLLPPASLALGRRTDPNFVLGAPGSRVRDGVCIVRRPPFSHCVLGRTPASGRRAPQNGGLRRCLNSGLGSLFAAQDEPRYEREPHTPRKRLIIAPHLGGRVVQTRGSDRGQRPRRGRVASHTRLLMQRSGSQNTPPSAREHERRLVCDLKRELGAARGDDGAVADV